jgi:hypothetical protein
VIWAGVLPSALPYALIYPSAWKKNIRKVRFARTS